MLMKLLVSAFERAKCKFTTTHSSGRNSPESDGEDNDFDAHTFKKLSASGSSIVQHQPRVSLSKWLCTAPASSDRPSLPTKSSKVRRSSSWRSLKDRGTHYIGHLTSRTVSVDELHRHEKQNPKMHSLRKQQVYQRRDLPSSPMVSLMRQRHKSAGLNAIRLSNCDDSPSLSSYQKRFDRLSSTFIHYSDVEKRGNASTKSSRRNDQQSFSTLSRHNTSSGGGDSGYSEDSFAATNMFLSQTRPLHTSCPHCHCEQRSSFVNVSKSQKSLSSESSTSDTTINKETLSSDPHSHRCRDKHSLSASRSYPHIKPLPKTTTTTTSQTSQSSPQQRPSRTLTAKRRRRRRHVSCDSSLWPKAEKQPSIDVRPPLAAPQPSHASLQRHFTTIGMLHGDPSSNYSKNVSALPKTTHIFGELNLAAIELDSLRTLDYHRASLSSSSYSSSVASSSSSINTDKHWSQTRSHAKRSLRRKGTFLVWHEYKNSSLLSTTHGTNIFSVKRGDQVRLLRRVGKSTLLVQKEDDSSIGFLPQSCLAHDQINSFLSVKGLKETVL